MTPVQTPPQFSLPPLLNPFEKHAPFSLNAVTRDGLTVHPKLFKLRLVMSWYQTQTVSTTSPLL